MIALLFPALAFAGAGGETGAGVGALAGATGFAALLGFFFFFAMQQWIVAGVIA
jgi:hypothetical protein